MNFVGILSVWNASLVYSPFRVSLVLIAATVFGCSGCSTAQFVTLRAKPRNPLTERLQLWSPAGPEPSERTEEFLAASGATQSRDVRILLQHTRRAVKQFATEDSLHAAAELSYLTARQTESDDTQLAAELYLDAAHYSWQYLAGNGNVRVRNPNAVEHRVTTDVYNSSVEGFMRLMNSEQSGEHREGFSLPLTGRSVRFEVPQPSAWIHPDQVGEIEFVSDYEVNHLRHRHVASGIGVPIMIHRQRPERPSQLEEYYAEGLRFPATALLRFPTPQEQYSAKPIRLQIYDPRDSESVVVRDSLVPIETDLSTPLARFLTNPDLELLDTFAFLRPDKAESLQGLYMVQPWDPDRIPVLMVHGLWSSPITWMEMFNELQSDPVLRAHYQFWFYMYPTGEPLAFSLADLRDDLEELQERCDPLHRNAKLDQMVLVGHSMGGLLSYLLTVDSGDTFWKSVSDTPVTELPAHADTTSEIERVFFFESDPSIDRIITLATPFQGSRYANRFTRWLSQAIVSLPEKTLKATQLMTGLDSRQGWKNVFTPRTSLDSLAKESAVVNLIGQTTTQDSVIHNNIIGVSRGQSLRWWTDGVVTYRSAHRDDADSEITVAAGHSQIHRHEIAIKEVRRALRDHLTQVKDLSKVITVGQSTE